MTDFPSDAEWKSLNDRLHGIPAQIEKFVDRIFDGVNHLLDQWWCPHWVAGMIKPVLDKLVALTHELLEKLSEIAVGFLFPIQAVKCALVWGDGVKDPINRSVALVSDANLKVGDYWTGAAATAYENAVTAQTGAMSELASIAGDVESHLIATASGLFAFYMAMLGLYVQWVAMMMAAAAATASAEGAVPGVAGAAGDTAVAIGLVITGIVGVGSLVTTEGTTYAGLQGRISSSSKLPGGHWPPVTTSVIGNASDRNGNDGKWHYNS